MLKRVKRRLGDSQDGFTLIELLVVITILGILAAVVVFSVGGIGDKGQDSACKADFATIQTAEEAYYAKNNTYGTEGQLVAGPPKVLSSLSVLHSIKEPVSATAYDIDNQDTKCPDPMKP